MPLESAPTPIARVEFRPGRLWSLWDMLKFNAPSFLYAITTLQSGRFRIEGHLRADTDRTLEKAVIPQGDRDSAPETLAALYTEVTNIGARVTAMSVASFIEELEGDTNKTMTIKRFAECVADIDSRLGHELALVKLYVLDSDKSKYYEAGPGAFGTDAADCIPQAIPDIEDAGKCIALQQGTASVFHSMRVMEAALKSLAALLGIPYAPSWESFIKQIEEKISAKHKTKGIRWKRDESFYREILGNLQTIKIAWRNPTMHIVRRYSVDEAEEIYIAVRGFIKRLAPRLPKPKATKITKQAF